MASFCLLGGRQALAGDSHLEVEAHLDNGPAQSHALDDLGEQLPDAGRAIGLAARDLAEQDVVLDAAGRVVGARLEELHGAPQILGQGLGERLAGLQNPFPHVVLDQPQAVAGGDELEGKLVEQVPVLLRDVVDSLFLHLVEDSLEFRQVVGLDETELLEELVAGGQVVEQLDHDGGE